MIDLIVNLIKYFGKFPFKDAVLDLFTRTTGKLAGYDDLKDYITNLPDGLIPGLTGFIISVDEDEIKEIVESQNGYFLLLEYFQFKTTAPDNTYSRDTTFSLALSVMHNQDKQGTDLIEEALIMDQCLNYILELKDLILSDDSELCAWLRNMDSGIMITPVEPRLAWQNLGWVLSFEKQIDGLI